MRMALALVAGAACVAAVAGMVLPDVSVEVKNVHLCCPACEKAIGKILEDAKVKGTCSKDTRMVSFTAADNAAAQKVLDALSAAGFHGDTGKADLKMKDDSGAKPGKVASMSFKGIHNCCPMCQKAIKEVLTKVEGVKGDDVKPRVTTFTVTGDFEPTKVVMALNAAGYHVMVDAK